MKYIPGGEIPGQAPALPILELTRRNLEVLLKKLDDPASMCMIGDRDNNIWVKAVENEEHYANREPGRMILPSTGEDI